MRDIRVLKKALIDLVEMLESKSISRTIIKKARETLLKNLTKTNKQLILLVSLGMIKKDLNDLLNNLLYLQKRAHFLNNEDEVFKNVREYVLDRKELILTFDEEIGILWKNECEKTLRVIFDCCYTLKGEQIKRIWFTEDFENNLSNVSVDYILDVPLKGKNNYLPNIYYRYDFWNECKAKVIIKNNKIIKTLKWINSEYIAEFEPIKSIDEIINIIENENIKDFYFTNSKGLFLISELALICNILNGRIYERFYGDINEDLKILVEELNKSNMSEDNLEKILDKYIKEENKVLSKYNFNYKLKKVNLNKIKIIEYNFLEYIKIISLLKKIKSKIEIFKVNLIKKNIPKIKGKVIKINEKTIQKKNVQAHVRRVKMSNEKRVEVLSFLQDNNLNIKGLGTVTLENFNIFDWNKMTIVESFEKNIKVLKKDESVIENYYIKQHQEKQKKLKQANKIHQDLVRKMAYIINGNGYESLYNQFIDLFYKIDDKIIIFEMKSIKIENEYAQLMKAYSQLKAYPYICNIFGVYEIERCIVLNTKPNEKRLNLLFRDEKINIIWQEGELFNTYEWSSDTICSLLQNQTIVSYL